MFRKYILLTATAWLFLANVWLVYEPRFSIRFADIETVLCWVPLTVSLLLILLVTMDACCQLLQHGQHHALLGDVLILIMLFTVAFMQISTHIGSFQFAHNFAAEPIHWLLFSLGNALRAADLADLLKDYGVFVPQITPSSWMACSLLITYRSIIDVLFLGYALRTVKRVGEWIRDLARDQAASMIDVQVLYFWVCLLFMAIWMFIVLWWTPWTVSNQVLWLVDNSLRVIDIFDAMQIFGLRLDAVHNDPLEITLGISFRLLIAVTLAAPLCRQQDRFGQWLRAKFGYPSEPAAKTSLRTTGKLVMAGCALTAFSVGLSIVNSSRAETHQQLVLAVQSDQHAHGVIRRLGINCAANVMHPLHQVAVDPSRPEHERLQAIRTLTYFRAPSAELLVDCIRQYPALAVRIVDSITRVGPSGSAALVALMGENNLAVRRRALEQLRRWGSESIFHLSPEISGKTVAYYYSLFDIIYPSWDRQRGTGRWFRTLVESKRAYRELQLAVADLRSDTSFQRGRAAEQTIEHICHEMKWSPPNVAEELIQLEAFLNSEQFQKLKEARLEDDIRSSFAGRSRYAGVDARHQSDPVEDAKIHLINLLKRHPHTAIDVFWRHHRGGNPIYVDSAAVCFRDVLGQDFEPRVRDHLRRPLHHRVFDVDAAPVAVQWSAPDVRQVLIDARLIDVTDQNIPPWPRDQLSVDDATAVVSILSDAGTEVWADVIDELQRAVYSVDFTKQLTTAGSTHDSADVRRRVAGMYPNLPDGQELLRKHLSLESDPNVIATLVEVAAGSELLAPTMIASLEPLTEMESETVSAAIAKLLTNEATRDIDRLATLADRRPLYEEQLNQYVNSATSLLELSEISQVGPESSRRAALQRLLTSGPDGHALYLDLLASVSKESAVDERCQWFCDALRTQYPKLFDADFDGTEGEVGLEWKQVVAQCVRMLNSDRAVLRRSAIDLLRNLALPVRRNILSSVYQRLKTETEPELRREIIELFVATPPQGIKGVIAWRKHELDAQLIRHMDEIIDDHSREAR